MLILLSLLLAFIAFRSLRGGNGGRMANLLTGGLLTGALVSAGGGVTLIDSALAIGVNLITNPAGQTLSVQPDQANFYENTSGVTQEIRSLNLPLNRCESYGSEEFETSCTVGETLENGSVCVVDCRPIG